MQITGERALVNIENETFYTKRIDVADDETIPLDALFQKLIHILKMKTLYILSCRLMAE